MENKGWTVSIFILNFIIGTVLLFMGQTMRENDRYYLQELKEVRLQIAEICHVAGDEQLVLIISNEKAHADIRQDLALIKEKLGVK